MNMLTVSLSEQLQTWRWCEFFSVCQTADRLWHEFLCKKNWSKQQL